MAAMADLDAAATAAASPAQITESGDSGVVVVGGGGISGGGGGFGGMLTLHAHAHPHSRAHLQQHHGNRSGPMDDNGGDDGSYRLVPMASTRSAGTGRAGSSGKSHGGGGGHGVGVGGGGGGGGGGSGHTPPLLYLGMEGFRSRDTSYADEVRGEARRCEVRAESR